MSGEKIEKARAAALEAVRRLAPDDLFSLVVYNNTAETLIPARRVGDGAELEDIIRSIRSFGGTALHAGVTQGAAELRHHTDDSRYLHRLILLSDGLANVGPSSPEELARLGGRLVQEGISVTTVGVGFVAAFISGLFVVRWLLDYVSNKGFALFAVWRIVVGILGLIGLYTIG